MVKLKVGGGSIAGKAVALELEDSHSTEGMRFVASIMDSFAESKSTDLLRTRQPKATYFIRS